MPALTTGYRGTAAAWTGLVKLDGKVLVECGHTHFSRDAGSRRSAVSCAQSLLLAAARPDLEGGPHDHRAALHARIADDVAVMLRRGLRKADADATAAAWHTHIDETVGALRTEIAAGATVPTRY
jgi:hypothetical protein